LLSDLICSAASRGCGDKPWLRLLPLRTGAAVASRGCGYKPRLRLLTFRLIAICGRAAAGALLAVAAPRLWRSSSLRWCSTAPFARAAAKALLAVAAPRLRRSIFLRLFPVAAGCRCFSVFSVGTGRVSWLPLHLLAR